MQSERVRPQARRGREDEAMRYSLDPDFRRNAPEEGAYCVRCQKPIKGKSIKVSVDWDTWAVWQDDAGEHLMGPDCWKVVSSTEAQGIL